MREVLAVFETGIVLTTPIFFVVTLIVLWRILRAVDANMAVAVHVKRQLEVVRGGGLAAGVRATEKVQEAEKRFHGVPEEPDADHSG